jgi:hypothetical protein
VLSALAQRVCRLGRQESLFVFVENNVMPVRCFVLEGGWTPCDGISQVSHTQQPNATMSQMYNLHKDADGFLYVVFSSETAKH